MQDVLFVSLLKFLSLMSCSKKKMINKNISKQESPSSLFVSVKYVNGIAGEEVGICLLDSLR